MGRTVEEVAALQWQCHPHLCLLQLPKIMRCIHKNLDSINTAPARQSMASLLLLMADRRPGKVLTTLLRIAPPGDRTALDMWDMMISTPRPLKKTLTSLRKRLLVIDSTFPGGVISGSERADMARKIQSLLPQVVGLLDYGNTEMKRKVLAFFRSVMGHLKREEARPAVEQLEEKLLPLFDDVRLMTEPEPCGWAACSASCPPAQPRGQHWEQALLPWALVGWLLGFAAQHSSLLHNLTMEHLPSCQPRYCPCSPWAESCWD
ncbi:uncharacterized protein [Patagioenas fasciata]|uniref:uncharacterized protein n=1 Tax=Patagioenas fasciata TaxID=372321 RepID=UPI003A98FC71